MAAISKNRYFVSRKALKSLHSKILYILLILSKKHLQAFKIKKAKISCVPDSYCQGTYKKSAHILKLIIKKIGRNYF